MTEPKSSPLKSLREQKGLSQKELADKIGMERTRLLRIERRPWCEISLGDLEIISSGLGLRIHELLTQFNGFGKENLCNRARINRPHFKVDTGNGYRFGSLLAKPEGCFVGTLHLDPHKTLPAAEAPKAIFLFYVVVEGTMVVTVGGREHRIITGESFSMDGTRSYELYNPHQINPATALVFALPSFIQSP